MVLINKFDFAAAIDTFYEDLFENVPELKVKFNDPGNQKIMMLVVLQSISDKARGDGQLKDYMAMLGEKHKSYGLTKQHMEAGRQAFQKAIEAGGKNASKKQKQHYLDAFTELERAMGFDVGIG